MEIKTKDIIRFIENDFTSLNRQYEWDSNGIQIFAHDKKISKIVFTLEPTKDAIEFAIKEGCELMITHHPLFFRPLKYLDFSTPIGEKIIKCVKHGVNLLSYHTVLDRADYSLNDYLAELIGARVISGFTDFGKEEYYKLVVYVPRGYENKIIDAIDNAGGGKIGNYSKCTFYTDGIGTFLPEEGTNPFIGKIGRLEEANEYRLESIVKKKYLNSVINAVLSVHPYEEVAYDVYKLEIGDQFSLGRVCSFDEKVGFYDFFSILADKLGIENIKHNNPGDDFAFEKFAVVTGSGASLWKDCKNQNIKVFLTSDMKYHDAVDAYENGVYIIDIGHYESEFIFMNYLSSLIAKKFNVKTIAYKNKVKINHWRLNNA